MTFEPVYVIDGARSPFLKARNAPGPFTASDLAVQTGLALLLRQPFSPTELSEVILGCTTASAEESNIGRLCALRLGCGDAVPGWTVMRNCASGMQAIDSGMQAIQTGRSDLVLVGGTDALSHAPLLLSPEMVRWLGIWNQSKSLTARLKALQHLRPQYLKPIMSLLKGLTDPTVGLSMGQTAEELAYLFNISRTEMDAYAARSHQLARQGYQDNAFDEVVPITSKKGDLFRLDDGIRDDSTPEKLAKLRAVFDPPWGNITAGNSSQISDGAALIILASEKAVVQHQLTPLAKIIDVQWAALDPRIMGLGPVFAATPLLERHKLGLNDIDLWEINEAFAAQVLGCLAAWKDEEWCQTHLGRPALGELSMDRLNIHGGAIAIGHPVGASGARILLHLINSLTQQQKKRGLAAICIGGGQGGAMLVERLDGAEHG